MMGWQQKKILSAMGGASRTSFHCLYRKVFNIFKEEEMRTRKWVKWMRNKEERFIGFNFDIYKGDENIAHEFGLKWKKK
jgi:hypothetical protein